MKENHDRKGVENHLHENGDLVWLSMTSIFLRHPSQRGQMVPRFIGPVKIINMMAPHAVSLQLPANLNVHSTVSVVLIKPFFKRRSQEAPPVVINGIEEFELEAWRFCKYLQFAHGMRSPVLSQYYLRSMEIMLRSKFPTLANLISTQ